MHICKNKEKNENQIAKKMLETKMSLYKVHFSAFVNKTASKHLID